jgi:hypothetical protein
LTIKQDKVTTAVYSHPFIITALLVLVVLLSTGMQIDNNAVCCTIMVLGYLLVTGYGIYLKQAKKLSDEALITLIFALGFFMRLGYTLYTGLYVRQCDLGEFTEGSYNSWHSGYILYVRDHMWIPNIDVTGKGEFYHPPFHYFVSAVFLRITDLFLPKGTHHYEALQALSMLWTQWALIMAFKVVKQAGVKKEHLPSAAMAVSAFPALTLMSASINNDILSILLYFTAFYFGLKWFQERGWKNIIFAALAVGFGMMTKLSVGMIAFPVGFLFIVKLIKDIADKNDKKKKGKTFIQLVTFGVICAPLGLWFQIRNYLKYEVPLTYVLRADNPYQDLTKYTPVQRIFGFYGFPIEDFFMNLGSDGEQDYNIFIAQVKTALFGGENCRDDFTMSMAGYALLLVFLMLIILSVVGFIYTIITIKKRKSFWQDLSMIVLAVSQTASVISFSLQYPHICSQDFRYSTPFILCGTVFLLRAGEIKIPGTKDGTMLKVTRGLAAAFLVLAILFYTILWTYVKGAVAVVAPV